MAPGRRSGLALAAVLLLAGHIVALAVAGHGPRANLISDCFQLAVSVLAASACFAATRRSSRFPRSFWFVMGTAFALWSAGQVLQVYLDWTVRSWPIVQVLLFFISITAMFMAVFRSSVEREAGAVQWAWVLDAVQILVLIVALYLFLVYVPTLLYGQAAMGPLRLRLLHWRNIALVIGLAVRVLWSRGSERRLFAPIALAMGLYTVGTYFANHANLLNAAGYNRWYGLAWSVPFTLVTLHAATWTDPGDAAPAEPAPGAMSAVLLVYLPSLVVPVLLLSLYSQVVREQVMVGLSALMVSLICYSLRLALLHRQQRQTLDALRASEERYRSLFESNVAGVFRSTFDGRMLDCNRRLSELFGYTREELLSQPSWMLYPGGKEDRDTLVADRLRTGVPGIFEKCYRRKDGSLVWTITSASVGKEADGTPYFEGTILDVTDRRHLEEQLRQAQRMEAVGRLAGGIAHDFNNILTVISGYSSMLLERSSPSDPVHEDAKEIRSASDRAASLTRQLLAFSRQQVLQPQIVNLNTVLDALAKMVRRLIGEDIETRLVAAPGLGSVKADPGQIEQILLNLVVNARDAMPSGGQLTLETANVDLDTEYSAAHPYTSPGRHVLLAVSDTGIGMDAETRSRIFEPFYTTKEQGKGTGLGLSTVYGIVKQSGGHIEVYSEPGKGTTFKIYLPRVDQDVADSASPDRGPVSERGQETILLVEDDDALRDLAQRILSARGYTVLAPEKPEDAEAVCRQHPGRIDLLLTDVVMPAISGREVARRVALQRPDIKVLYMSGYTTNAIVHHGVLDEGLAFLPKPFTPATLTSKVREVLDGTPGA